MAGAKSLAGPRHELDENLTCFGSVNGSRANLGNGKTTAFLAIQQIIRSLAQTCLAIDAASPRSIIRNRWPAE
jgi:hypothetical protein